MEYSALLFSYLVWWRPIGYLIIFLGMILEGDIVLFTASFLTHQGFFDIGDMTVAILGGVLIGDIFWYAMGSRISGNAQSFFARWIERIAHFFDKHIRQRPFRTIFISKFAYGMHHALLARAGMIRLPFREFLRNDIAASALWILIVGGLGYGSSVSFIFLKHYLRFTEVVILAGILLILFLDYAVARRSRKIL